ncbi:hypothetical protein [Ensifer adhaerens]|uniref:hypothetical protein n=1 Tax=Ensifer adhaerens TaxID=106592 RepID=UPI0009902909|nr:hypothetical protein [Ensifer adhaerens]
MSNQSGYQCDDGSGVAPTRPSADARRKVIARPDELATILNRREKLKALRAEATRLRIELAAIAATASRIAVLEANAIVATAENGIRRHFAPALIAAGLVGYIWSVCRRDR